MVPSELTILLTLLHSLQDYQNNAGCNDFTLEPTPANLEFMKLYNTHTPETGFELKIYNHSILGQDILVLDYFMNKINTALHSSGDLELAPCESTILIQFLDSLSDHQSNAGCNDFEISATPGNLQFAQLYNNSVYEEGERLRIDSLRITGNDMLVTHYFMARLKPYLKSTHTSFK